MLSALIRSEHSYPACTAGAITGILAARPSRSSRTKDGSSQNSYGHAGYGLSGPNKYALTQIFQKESRPVDGAPEGSHLHLLSLRARVCHPNTRICVGLLGPCYKTGRLKPFRQHPKLSCGKLAGQSNCEYNQQVVCTRRSNGD